ncbi:MAG: glycosyltransferase [Cyanobacteria bacterium RI_101]|nr:glycosyltransferase [Cyanobacteria bacterium RI_101]
MLPSPPPDPQFDPLSALIPGWDDPEAEEAEFREDFFKGQAGRRQKAALVLMAVWGTVFLLHRFAWGLGVVWALASLLALQALRLMRAKPIPAPTPLEGESDLPFISLLVAAKNEERVIESLVNQLCNLDYPQTAYEVWIVDDHSADGTPEILQRLAPRYPHLHILRRPANAGGGKSGALNEVLAQTQGEIIGVFDADAQVPAELLRQVAPFFQEPGLGAVQTRKAIANSAVNFWTQGQATEMALDLYFQQQRIALGGIGELRGNGQFVSRQALADCGGWNEQTITDDLDLTIRLHLQNWRVEVLSQPPVREEGVTSASALWHQRNRWAEGGYQRYLDYWRGLLTRPLGLGKKIDLCSFMLMQYLLPTAAAPDLVFSAYFHQLPRLGALTAIALSFSGWGMVQGLRRALPPGAQPPRIWFSLLSQTLLGTIYMLHWLVIMPCVTARMALRPKRLKWVKTVHGGLGEESLELKGGET